jgi:hypothetical protein
VAAGEASAAEPCHERRNGNRNGIDIDAGKESQHALPDRLIKQGGES